MQQASDAAVTGSTSLKQVAHSYLHQLLLHCNVLQGQQRTERSLLHAAAHTQRRQRRMRRSVLGRAGRDAIQASLE